jgi:hypothetical protein
MRDAIIYYRAHPRLSVRTYRRSRVCINNLCANIYYLTRGQRAHETIPSILEMSDKLWYLYADVRETSAITFEWINILT